MKKAYFILFLFFIFPLSVFSQDNWQKGFYNSNPSVFPETAPKATDFYEGVCFFRVNKNPLGEIITERCFRGDDGYFFSRNIAFPSIPANLREGLVLTVKFEDETGQRCWINDTLFDLGRSPGQLQYINALFNIKRTYTFLGSKKNCEEAFRKIPDE